jgi:hypothetical protein
VQHNVPAPDPARFGETVALVQSYVRSEAGAHTALMSAAQRDPEGMTHDLVALGAVLLDIAAGAFRLSPDEVLDKVAATVADGPDVATA